MEAWLSNDAFGDEEAYEEEARRVGNFRYSSERGVRGLQRRIELSLAEEKRLFKFR